MAENKVCPHCGVSFVPEDWPDGTVCPVCGKGEIEERKSGMDSFFLGLSAVFSGALNVLFLLIKAGVIALVCYLLFLLYHYAVDTKKQKESETPAAKSLFVPKPDQTRRAMAALFEDASKDFSG